MVRVGHQAHTGADGTPDRRRGPQILIDAETDLDLHRAETARRVPLGLADQIVRVSSAFDAVEARRIRLDIRSERTAEELVHRPTDRLSHYVPQRDIHGADRADHSSAPAEVLRAVVHGFEEYRGVKRITPHDEIAQRRLDRRARDLRRLMAVAQSLAGTRRGCRP